MLQRTLPPQALEQYCFRLKVGQSQDLAQLAEALSAAGYIRCDQVEGVGQFALRGASWSVCPGMDAPARVEFFGDEVDAMGSFDLSTQRRTENLERSVFSRPPRRCLSWPQGDWPGCRSGSANWRLRPPRTA